VVRTLLFTLALVSIGSPALAQRDAASAPRDVEVVTLYGDAQSRTIEVVVLAGRAADGRAFARSVARTLQQSVGPALTDGAQAYRASATIDHGAIVALRVSPPGDRSAPVGIPAAFLEARSVHFGAGARRTVELGVSVRAPADASLADLDDAALAARFPEIGLDLLPLWVTGLAARVSPVRVTVLGEAHGATSAAIRRAMARIVAGDADAVRLCYQDLLSRWGPLAHEGSFGLELFFDTNGHLAQTGAHEDRIDSADLHRCVRTRAATWSFPAVGGWANIAIDWTLRAVPMPPAHAIER
jgi:hypothetical protein